jgi:HEAT repeat protein
MGGKIFELGRARTVDSCLGLLSSCHPVLREGAVRDLGRLAKQVDADELVPQIAPLMQDSSLYVRRGAAEALGLIALNDCVDILNVRLRLEHDEVTRLFILEALAMCAGRVLAELPAAPAIPTPEACNLYVSGSTSWAEEVLRVDIESQAPASTDVLVQRLESPDASERLASLKLLALVCSPEALERIRRLSEVDGHPEVRREALEILRQHGFHEEAPSELDFFFDGEK